MMDAVPSYLRKTIRAPVPSVSSAEISTVS
jgi:hypothetical protein